MKKRLLIFVLLLSACGEARPPISAEEQQKIDAATAAIKADLRVKDFYYEDAQWSIGVTPDEIKHKDEPIDQDGFAEFVYSGEICDILHDIGVAADGTEHIVRIYNINTSKTIRKISCDSYSRVFE